jgi:hypothetical protein
MPNAAYAWRAVAHPPSAVATMPAFHQAASSVRPRAVARRLQTNDSGQRRWRLRTRPRLYHGTDQSSA